MSPNLEKWEQRYKWAPEHQDGTTLPRVYYLPVDEQWAPSWKNVSVFRDSTLFSRARANNVEARLIQMKNLRKSPWNNVATLDPQQQIIVTELRKYMTHQMTCLGARCQNSQSSHSYCRMWINRNLRAPFPYISYQVLPPVKGFLFMCIKI